MEIKSFPGKLFGDHASWRLERDGKGGDPGGILMSMSDSTTIKVSVRTRDALRQLADREGLTLDAQLERMIRRERRRIIGAQLAGVPLDTDDRAVLDASAVDVADALG